MARGVTALVEPAMLVWARKTMALTVDEAATRARVARDKLLGWESGQPISVPQLRHLAGVYKRPLAAFYLPEPPPAPPPVHNFRSARGELTPELALEMRKARARRRSAIAMTADSGERAPALKARAAMNEDTDDVAARIRGLLGVAPTVQASWRDARVGFNAWRDAIEGLGILVFHAAKVETEDARGFSLTEEPFPVIAVNAKDAWPGRVFTLFHELAHVLLRQGGVCDLKGDTVEEFCNAVAGAALMPTKQLSTEPEVVALRSPARWPDDRIADLARRYSVSDEAMLRRLVTIGKAPLAQYRELRPLLRARRPRKEGERGPPPDVIALRDSGPRFARIVLDAYHRDAISAVDACQHLNVSMKYLDALEGNLARRAV